MPKRAATISIGTLTKSIDKAVELAAKRHGVKLGNENIIHNWEILGRILQQRLSSGTDSPIEIAQTIAKSAGLKGKPIAAKIGKDILVGVIPSGFDVTL